MPHSSIPSTSAAGAAGAIVVAGGASANGPTALLSSGFLAPGFRFHPTDEELVIYYLKRKISGRPLRIDAIAEIDVYKHEPWDLPPLSRLRTRDVEWYFFTPLDRKLSNRLRTNRGTPAGYWKTTGKDRPVRHSSSASAVVGFKKTLVFHTGRAPKGQRTNWVMHEFRLDDKELARKGICQDGYVLCRIFQKSGPGPQIGEQHGAPFVEEEWADPDEVVPSREGEEVEGFNSNGGLDYLQLTDVEQVNPNIYIATDGNVGVAEQPGTFLKEDDGFLQLDDIAQNGVNNSYIADSFQHSDGMYNYQKSVVEVGGNSNFPEKDGGEFFDAYNGNADQTYPYQTCTTAMDNTYVHLGDLPNHVADDCLIGQAADDTYYDAICHGVPTAKENFVQMNDPCQPMADSCEFDMFDAVIEYLNDTDDNLHYNLESLEELEKVNLPLKANIGTSIYSPVRVPEADDQSNITSESVIVKKDTQKNETQKNKPLKGRLLNMLGAIPSPPAFACEFPLTMKPSRQYCGNQTISNHLAADMHQMSKVWPLQNSRDMSFLLSCGMNGESLKPTRKSACGVLMMVFKSGLYLCFSALVLVASLKVGVYFNMR